MDAKTGRIHTCSCATSYKPLNWTYRSEGFRDCDPTTSSCPTALITERQNHQMCLHSTSKQEKKHDGTIFSQANTKRERFLLRIGSTLTDKQKKKRCTELPLKAKAVSGAQWDTSETFPQDRK